MKKEQMVGSRLPEEMVRDLETIERLEQSDRATTVRKLLAKAIASWKLDYFARQYGDGKVSTARAAREAGVTVWEMMEYLRLKKITSQYDMAALDHDLAQLEGEVSKGTTS
ncbi:MAG: hypothetical protein FJ319_07345 [SAR202 cluster bacterium]|nr:hypothetical protein [SAR202 cluster bacterium]